MDSPKVSLVAVVPMPDADMGEKACAYIQPEAECSLTFDEIIGFLKDCKASVLQLPERIEFVDGLPALHKGGEDRQAGDPQGHHAKNQFREPKGVENHAGDTLAGVCFV